MRPAIKKIIPLNVVQVGKDWEELAWSLNLGLNRTRCTSQDLSKFKSIQAAQTKLSTRKVKLTNCFNSSFFKRQKWQK